MDESYKFNGYNKDYFTKGIYDDHNVQIWHPVYPITKCIYDITECKNVLDVGCASGHFVEGFFNNGVNVEGIDISKWAISNPITERIRDHIHEGSVLDLPYGDNTFDLVYATDLIEHIFVDDIEKAMSELIRVSKRYIVLLICQSRDIFHRDAYVVKKGEKITDAAGHVTVQPAIWWYKLFMKFPVTLRLDFEGIFRQLLNPVIIQNWNFIIFLEKREV